MQLKSFEYIKNFVKTLTEKPGVYRMIAADNTVLYVGKAKNLRKRVTNYSQALRLNNRLIRMVEQVVAIDIIETKSEGEALLLEASLIKALKPKYNILLRDDKSFPYIVITNDNHDFPMVTKYRGKKHDKGYFFGPFASTKDMGRTIGELHKVFLLRNCTDSYFATRKRPCLEYQIKRCSAPCMNYITKDEYAENVEAAISFLKGDTSKIKASLADKMNELSSQMEYEKAAWYRDRIKALNTIESRVRINLKGETDVDVIGFARFADNIAIQIFFFRGGQSYGNKSYFPVHTEEYSNSEIIAAFIGQFYQNRIPPKAIWLSHESTEALDLKDNLGEIAGYRVNISIPKRGDAFEVVKMAVDNAESSLKNKMEQESKYSGLMEKICNTFNFPNKISRIEVYDNSHISGSYPVGVMVAAGLNGFEKSEYKKFNIKETSIGDDYHMLREVLTRRLKKLITSKQDYSEYLLLIDGGKGQRTIVEEVFESLGIRLMYLCIAKGKDRNAGKEHFYNETTEDATFSKNDDMMKYLQILRDEAHRFAIETHRKLRTKGLKTSDLDSIIGIGKTKKMMLLNYFGSVDAIKAATIDEIAKVPGFNLKSATSLKSQLF